MWYSILLSLAFSGRDAWASPCKPSHSGLYHTSFSPLDAANITESSALDSTVTVSTSEASSSMTGHSTTSVGLSTSTSSMPEETNADFTLSIILSTESVDIFPSSLSEEMSTSASLSLIELSTTLTTSDFDGLSTSTPTSAYKTDTVSISSDPATTSADSLSIYSTTYTTTGSNLAASSEMSSISVLITRSTETSTAVPLSTTADRTSSYSSLTTAETTAIFTTDSATPSVTTPDSPDTTSSSPATTSSAAPYRFRAISKGTFLAGAEMRAHYSSPWYWTIGIGFVHQNPTIFTMEPETGYLLSEGVRQCVAFDVTNYLIRILGCPAIMLPQHEYVTCDPVGADGDELRCGVAELKCVLSGVGSGRLCERTGTKWTQIQALPWLPGRYFVGFVAPTSTANADYNFGFVIKEETD